MSFVERFIIQCPYFGGSTVFWYIVLMSVIVGARWYEVVNEKKKFNVGRGL